MSSIDGKSGGIQSPEDAQDRSVASAPQAVDTGRTVSSTPSNHAYKIGLIEDADAIGDVAEVYDEWRAHSGRQQMPGILKCFSHRPDFLRDVMRFSNTVHFSEGHLDRKTKEAIASWVSWLNRCPY